MAIYDFSIKNPYKSFTQIDTAFEEQDILAYIEKFKTIYVVLEDEAGFNGLFTPFKTSRFHEKIKVIQFRQDIFKKSSGTLGDCKDPSELYLALNGDSTAFPQYMNNILSLAIPIDSYAIPNLNKPFKMDDDKRKETSPENGKSGGRPKSQPVDYVELCEYLAGMDEIKKYRSYNGNIYRWNIRENRYINVCKDDFKSTVKAVLCRLHKGGQLEEFNIQAVSIGTIKTVCELLLTDDLLTINTETTRENHYMNTEDDLTLYKALGNGIIDIRGMATELYNHWNEREEIEVSNYFHPKSMDFFNFTSLGTVEFSLHENCPQTEDILKHLLPDEEQRKAYWEMLAIGLLDDYKPNKLYMLYGQAGTGKTSVGLGIADEVFSNSSIRLKWGDLNPEESKFKTVALTENNLAIIDEMPNTLSRLNTVVSFIKDVTNGSKITTERKGQNPTTDNAKALLIFATNTLALLYQSAKNDELAIFDRVIPILFDVRVRDTENENRQINVIFKQELSGIFNKILYVLGELIENKYKMFLPERSKQKLDLMKNNAKNSFVLFLEDCCIVEATAKREAKFSISKVYDCYRRYMDELKETHPLSMSGFLDNIFTRGFDYFVDPETKTKYTNFYCKKYDTGLF